MIRTNKVEKTLLAMLALIIGFSVGMYLWNPNSQSVAALNIEDLNETIQEAILPIIVESIQESDENETIIILDVEDAPIQANMTIEKYRSSSISGPWNKADTRIGDTLRVGDEVFWKIEVNNTGEVNLDLNFVDYYDGYLIDLNEYTSLPTSIQPGETASIIYKTYVYSGTHKNEVFVSGSYEDIILLSSDVAFYKGVRSSVTSQHKDLDDTPSFVVPEYPLGSLGGFLSLIIAFGVSQRKIKNI